MERVEDWTLEHALQGEDEVLDSENEATTLNEEAQAHPVVFKLHDVVVEVEFLALLVIEDFTVWAFYLEDRASHTHINVLHFKFSKVLVSFLLDLSHLDLHLDLVLLISLPPARLNDETTLVEPVPDDEK